MYLWVYSNQRILKLENEESVEDWENWRKVAYNVYNRVDISMMVMRDASDVVGNDRRMLEPAV